MDNAQIFAHVDEHGLAQVIITDFDYPDSAAKKVLIDI